MLRQDMEAVLEESEQKEKQMNDLKLDLEVYKFER